MMSSPRPYNPPKDQSLLRNANFLLLLGAYGVSAIGDHLSEMAILKTQDALNPAIDITPLTARMTFAFFVPFLLLAPIGGVLADRLPRRLVMIVADLARCVLMFFFAYFILRVQHWHTWGPFLPLLLVGMFAAVFSPARSALLPTLVSPNQLVRANGLMSGLGIIGTMIAAQLGGFLADRYAPTVAFRLDSLTFVASATLLLFISRRGSRRTDDTSCKHVTSPNGSLRAGFRYAAGHRHVRELLLVAALVWFVAAMVNSLVPAVVRDVYGGTFQTISTYRMLIGLGFVLGALAITSLGDALRSEIAISWGLIGLAGAVATLASSVMLSRVGLSANMLSRIGAVSVVAGGFFAVAVMASLDSLLQRTVADRFRGRVFGVRDVCTTATLLLATGALGIPTWTRVDRWAGIILLVVAGLTFGGGMLAYYGRLRRGPFGVQLTFWENLGEFAARLLWGFRRLGRTTVPHTGPVIIAANHTCSADPVLLSRAVPYRPISFMIAEEYARWPIVRRVVRLLDCIPVKRDGRDTAATKHALRHLHAGKAVGIFIEGGIVAPDEKSVPKDGVAMLALRTGATVIPAFISGVIYHDNIVRGLFARHRARVHFGPPVDLAEFRRDKANREAVRMATARIFEAIQSLAPKE